MDGEISPDDVEAALGEAGLRVVDIRSRAAFDRGHIPGSRNLPMAELPTRVEELALDDADRIVTVCPHGKASVQAARLLASYEGTDAPVESMAGGLDAWTGPLEAAAADGGAGGGESARADDEGPDAPF
jgi:rhodanese-related sulfurtransferase